MSCLFAICTRASTFLRRACAWRDCIAPCGALAQASARGPSYLRQLAQDFSEGTVLPASPGTGVSEFGLPCLCELAQSP